MPEQPTSQPQDAAERPLHLRSGDSDSEPRSANSGQPYIVLAGNPNVGKSLFFNAWTGIYVNVSNFPGTTVDVPSGDLTTAARTINDTSLPGLLKDTPGVYGITGLSEEETVAARAILEADIVINVVSAISLERDLFLTQQIIDYGIPLVVAVNMMDEAKSRQLTLDLTRLEKLLGVPVVPTIAVQRSGLDNLLKRLPEATVGNPTPDLPVSEVRTLEAHPGERIRIYGHRRAHVNAVVSNVVSDDSQPDSKGAQASRIIGQWLLHPLVGLLSLIGVLVALYQIIGVWVAGDLVNLLEGKIFLGDDPAFFTGIIPFIQGIVAQAVPRESWMFALIAGEFGVLTMSLQYIFGVLFPLVLGFYLYISILEDCGYLPRVAVLTDGLLNRIGLNGRAVIPLILGFGCVTMATVSTRVLTSQRERTIASTLLAITIPCSAQLAVIMALMALVGGLKGWGLYIAALFSVMAIIGTVLNRVLPGKSSGLVLDLPPMRMPSPKNILKKSWVRTRIFLLEAAPLFIWGSAIVAVLQISGLLKTIERWLSPVTEAVLYLPGETAQAFIMGMVRRDFGAAGLLQLKDVLTPAQILTTLIVITLFVPCLASIAVIGKERGTRETTLIVGGSWLIAFAVGAVMARLLDIFPII